MVMKFRMVKFARIPSYNQLFSGDPVWATLEVAGMGPVSYTHLDVYKRQGFDAAVADMKVGEIKEIHLMPEEAYGQPNPDAIFTLEIEQLPGAEDLTVGQQVYLSNQYGQPFPVKVTAKDEKTITFDANHEMAGKELNFKIELVEVK